MGAQESGSLNKAAIMAKKKGDGIIPAALFHV